MVRFFWRVRESFRFVSFPLVSSRLVPFPSLSAFSQSCREDFIYMYNKVRTYTEWYCMIPTAASAPIRKGNAQCGSAAARRHSPISGFDSGTDASVDWLHACRNEVAVHEFGRAGLSAARHDMSVRFIRVHSTVSTNTVLHTVRTAHFTVIPVIGSGAPRRPLLCAGLVGLCMAVCRCAFAPFTYTVTDIADHLR